MKKIVSFFGEPSPVFDELNRRAEAYAAQKGFDYRWVPQKPFHQDQVIQCLREADMGLIDVEPYGEEIFRIYVFVLAKPQAHPMCLSLAQ